MKQLVTTGIILARTDYGEADRILTLLTPDHGKLSLLAKGVRRVKSKLAGGIELFSISQITFIKGRGRVDSLISTRLLKHYDRIVKDLDRTMVGYELIKQLNRATEAAPEADYFHLTEQLFEALDDPEISLELIKLWFAAQLLRLGGRVPNLQTDPSGAQLDPQQTYHFDFERMAFASHAQGQFGAAHIKYLRLAFGGSSPKALNRVQNGETLRKSCVPLVQTMLQSLSLL